MSCIFNSEFLLDQNNNKDIFGLVQQNYDLKNVAEGTFEKKKCKKCGCFLFPDQEKQFKCPYCEPNSNFINSTVQIDGGFNVPAIYFFVFDFTFPIATIQRALTDLAKEVPENAKICILCSALKQNYLIYDYNQLPAIDCFNSLNEFFHSDAYFVSPSSIDTIIVPALFSLYNILQSQSHTDQPIDVTVPIEICRKQIPNQLNELYSIIFFTSREIKPIVADNAFLLGDAICKSGGILHFGAQQNFKRLTAISRPSFGIVFGISEYVDTTMKKLVSLSRPQKIKIIAPRFIETTKVTGADGNLRLTSLLSIIKLKNGRGVSLRFNVDYQRMSSSQQFTDRINIMEVLTNDKGQFLTLHFLKVPQKPEDFKQSMNEVVTNSIICKGAASDILRPVYSGEQYFKVLNQFSKRHELSYEVLKNVEIHGLGSKEDRETLRLYYVLHKLFNEQKSGEMEVDGNKLFIAPPSVYIYSQENDLNKLAESVFQSEWPYELYLFKDESAMKLLISHTNK